MNFSDSEFLFIKERYFEKFNDSFENLEADFIENFKIYQAVKPFKACENVFEKNPNYNDKVHYITRLATEIYLRKAFEAMHLELDDNTAADYDSGNIGTFGRLAKVWCAANTSDDTEMGSGRFMKKPRIATFPNDKKTNIPITKRISIISNCSHHFLSFSTLFSEDSYAIVSYIPDEFVLGISKLQRLADYVCRRFWLQEDLTKALYAEISEAAKTKDVYVGLFNLRHTCEWLRGSKNMEGGFTSEYYDGAFLNSELRNQVLKCIK